MPTADHAEMRGEVRALSVIPPPPAPSPPPMSPLWNVTEGHEVCHVWDEQGSCVTGKRHQYGHNEFCRMVATTRIIVSTSWYSVIPPWGAHQGDFISIRGTEYHNATRGPNDIILEAGESMTWQSDEYGSGSGFDICGRAAVDSTPPDSLHPSPPPPPTLRPPSPTPPPPSSSPPERSPPPPSSATPPLAALPAKSPQPPAPTTPTVRPDPGASAGSQPDGARGGGGGAIAASVGVAALVCLLGMLAFHKRRRRIGPRTTSTSHIGRFSYDNDEFGPSPISITPISIGGGGKASRKAKGYFGSKVPMEVQVSSSALESSTSLAHHIPDLSTGNAPIECGNFHCLPSLSPSLSSPSSPAGFGADSLPTGARTHV